MDPVSEILMIIEVASKAEPVAVGIIQDGIALLKTAKASGTDPTADEVAALRASAQQTIQLGDSLMPPTTPPATT